MEKLICNCVDADKNPVSTNHVQSKDKNEEIVVECKECGRFIKYPKGTVVSGVPEKEE